MVKRPELKIENGPLAGRRFKVGNGVLRLGRSSSNDICVEDVKLSRNHCIFEPFGEAGIRLTDLASANGTYLNGADIKGEPVNLAAGDLVEVGDTRIRVVNASSASVDLGLAPSSSAPLPPPVKMEKGRSPLLAVALWLVALAMVGVAGYLLFVEPNLRRQPTSVAAVEEAVMVRTFAYEKVRANLDGIFRYELVLTESGELRATVDDVPQENRHLVKTVMLGDEARKALNELLSPESFKGLEREYSGLEPVPPALNSLSLKVVYDGGRRSVKVVNADVPAVFATIVDKLETFSKNELGIWAMQYSRDQLLAMAEDSVRLGKSKWEDRDVEHGNLFASAKAFREAAFYLETVNPKPPCMAEAEAGLKRSLAELDKRYADRRFAANRAINMTLWESARDELKVLIQMIPDRNDERFREASAKLIDVERRLKEGGK